MMQPSYPPKTVRVYLTSLAAILMIGLGTISAAWAQDNTAYGTNALISNTTGTDNSAFGVNALEFNTAGFVNTALGFDALQSNTTGLANNAIGESALLSNTTGYYNTAIGNGVLYANTTGSSNTATGDYALASNTTGTSNTVAGQNALIYNSTGSNNSAFGLDALLENTTAGKNTAIGTDALYLVTTGGKNIGIGYQAGFNLTTGGNNIDIGNLGVAGEAKKIRIGTAGTQTATFIAGISGTSLTSGTPVVVNSSGQLGVLSSSARYKRDIRTMGDASDKLMKLRPVTFRYKADETGAQQYGLIAEEVAKVYPELVIHGADGKVETVAYHMLPAMLLNEVQKQARANQRLAHQLAQKDAQIATLRQRVDAMQKKNVEIDTLAARLDALERQARVSRPDRLASATR